MMACAPPFVLTTRQRSFRTSTGTPRRVLRVAFFVAAIFRASPNSADPRVAAIFSPRMKSVAINYVVGYRVAAQPASSLS